MMNKKINVAMLTSHFDITGVGTVMMNYCKMLDKCKYNLTIIAGSPIADKYNQECKEFKINLIELPSRHKNPQKHYMALWKVLKKGNYDILHDHGNSSMMAVELTIAKLAGIKIRIAHSHNSTCSNMKIHKALNPYFKTTYTKALACGKQAGDWLFGKEQFEILPNGFNTSSFYFSKENREDIRNNLGIAKQLVIGHIGRFNMQKNQEYLLKIFEKIAEKRKDSILLLVGTGPDAEKIKMLVEQHKYKNQIILYGETDNPAFFYSAMDVFVFPSRFEGLPVVLLEAQISGLPCVVSNKVTQEVDFGDINWQSIDDSPDKWSDAVLTMKVRSDQKRDEYRKNNLHLIEKFDINQSIKQLDEIYAKLILSRN